MGVGDGVNDTLMNTVTDAGRGAYVYVDTEAEADAMFGARFHEVMDVAARAVQVELRLPWYLYMQVFHGEEYSTDPRVIEPQHLAPGDAMVFNQLIAACAPGQVVASDPIEVVARWNTAIVHAARQTSVSTTLGAITATASATLAKGHAVVAWAEALKSPSESSWQTVIAACDAADPSGADHEFVEIRALAVRAAQLY